MDTMCNFSIQLKSVLLQKKTQLMIVYIINLMTVVNQSLHSHIFLDKLNEKCPDNVLDYKCNSCIY